MEKLFEKLDLIRKRFQDLEREVENKVKTGKKEDIISLIRKLDNLMDDARDLERNFLYPTSLPLSVEIFDALKRAKQSIGIN